MSFWDKAIVFLATGFYTGNIPKAPGTFGTLPGLFLCFFLAQIPLTASILLILVLIGLSIWIAGRAEKIVNQKDPGCIVIDEIVGMAVALAGLPFNVFTAGVGFLLFRFFDIIKPWPIGFLDRRVHGGLGIVLDDVIAGIVANSVLRICMLLLN